MRLSLSLIFYYARYDALGISSWNRKDDGQFKIVNYRITLFMANILSDSSYFFLHVGYSQLIKRIQKIKF